MGKLSVFSKFTRKFIGRETKENSKNKSSNAMNGKSSSSPFLPCEKVRSLDDAGVNDSATFSDKVFQKSAKSLPGDSFDVSDDWLYSASFNDCIDPIDGREGLYRNVGVSDKDNSSSKSGPPYELVNTNSSRNAPFKDLPAIFVESSQYYDNQVTSCKSFPRTTSAGNNLSGESDIGVDVNCNVSDPGAYCAQPTESCSNVSWNIHGSEDNNSRVPEHRDDKPNEADESFLYPGETTSIEGIQPFLPTDGSFVPISYASSSPSDHDGAEKAESEENAVHYSAVPGDFENKMSFFNQNSDSDPSQNDFQVGVEDYNGQVRILDEHNVKEDASEIENSSEREIHPPPHSAIGIKALPLQNLQIWDKLMDKGKRGRIEQWIIESALDAPPELEEWSVECAEDDFQFFHSEPVEPKRSFSTTQLQHLEEPFANAKASSSALLDVDVEMAARVARSIDRNAVTAYLAAKGLRLIPGLTSFHHLKSVSLSYNSISRINAGAFPRSLHVLDLSHNRISSIEGLRELSRLRVLNLSHNRISRIGHGLSGCSALKELYLSDNKISEVEGLHRLLKLSVLDLSHNKITSTKALTLLAANYGSMQVLNLVGNPIHVNLGGDAFKRLITSLLPHLLYLNKQAVKAMSCRDFATDKIARVAVGSSRGASKSKSSAHRTSSNPRHKGSSSSNLRTLPLSSNTAGHSKSHRPSKTDASGRHGSKSSKTDPKVPRHHPSSHHSSHHTSHHHHDRSMGAYDSHHARTPASQEHHPIVFSECCRDSEIVSTPNLTMGAGFNLPLTSN